jgi:hypothetical protein
MQTPHKTIYPKKRKHRMSKPEKQDRVYGRLLVGLRDTCRRVYVFGGRGVSRLRTFGRDM